MTTEADANERKAAAELVQQHINALAEHFDTVQVFVTRHDGPSQTERTIARGAGSWFTRYGQVKMWVIEEEEQMRLDRRDEHDGREG